MKFDILSPILCWSDRLLEKNKPQYFYPLLLGILTTLSLLILLFPGIPAGHDVRFHLARFLTVAEGLKNGIFPAWINYYAADGFGYGTGLFYSDLFLYPAALLVAVGVPVTAAYKIFLYCWAMLTVFSMYFVVLRIAKDQFAAFAAALLYCMSSYFAVDLFPRAALGEVTAFLFVPWCILGIYQILYTEKPSIVALVFGYAGLFYAHQITFVLMSFIALLIFAFNIPKLLSDIRRIFALVVAGIFALCLVAAAIVPMVEQLMAIRVNLTTATMSSPIAERMVPWLRLFLELPYMKTEFWGPPGIGLIFLFVAVQRFRVTARNTPAERFRDLALVTGFVALFSATNFLPWEGMMRVFASIQFPWRLYLPATAFLAVGGGLLLGELLAGKKTADRRNWIIYLICGCGFAWSFNVCYTYAAKISEKQIIIACSPREGAVYATSGLHYLPQGTTLSHYQGRGNQAILHQSDGKQIELLCERPAYGRLLVAYTGAAANAWLQIPLVYYKGYVAEVRQGNSVSKQIPHLKDDKHFMVNVPEGSGSVLVYYRNTRWQILSGMVSLVAFCGLAFLAFRRRKACEG